MGQIIALAKTLIRFRTTSGNIKEFNRLIRFLKSETKKRRIKGFFVFHHEKVPTVFLTNRNSFSHSFNTLLQGHLDVVDGRANLFTPRIFGTRLYGRGAIDMKTSCALMIELLAEREIQQSKKHIGLMLSFDEESGSANGAGQWQKKLRGKLLINLDGGHDLAVIVAERGIIKVTLSVAGTALARCLSWQSPTQADPHQKLIADLYRLSCVFPHQTRQDATAMIVQSLATHAHPREPYSIAREAMASLVFYFVREGSCANLLSKIKKELHHSRLTVQATAEPVQVNRRDPMLRLFQRSLSHTTGRSVPFEIDNGSSDARFFKDSFHTVLITRPMGGSPHGADEWCSLRELPGLYRALKSSIV